LPVVAGAFPLPAVSHGSGLLVVLGRVLLLLLLLLLVCGCNRVGSCSRMSLPVHVRPHAGCGRAAHVLHHRAIQVDGRHRTLLLLLALLLWIHRPRCCIAPLVLLLRCLVLQLLQLVHGHGRLPAARLAGLLLRHS
jgi:hypothetical protein